MIVKGIAQVVLMGAATVALAAGTSVADRHSAAGVAAADKDYPGLVTLCTAPPPPAVTPQLVRANGPRKVVPLPPAQVFENLYFVGHRGVSAWVIKTSTGLVLVDTLNNADEARTFIEDGLIKLGLNPADVKTLIITHGHGDHTGGAAWFVGKYHPSVVMSAIDWAMIQDPKTRIDAPGWADMPKPDMLVDKRQVLQVGDTAIELRLTPGHTPGTLSLVFPVRDGKVVHQAVLWGGTGFNFGPDTGRYKSYAASAEATRKLVLARGIDVFLSNHPTRDQADVKIEALKLRAEGAPHPFVSSPRTVANAFVTFRECALTQSARIAEKRPR